MLRIVPLSRANGILSVTHQRESAMSFPTI